MSGGISDSSVDRYLYFVKIQTHNFKVKFNKWIMC